MHEEETGYLFFDQTASSSNVLSTLIRNVATSDNIICCNTSRDKYKFICELSIVEYIRDDH